MSRSSNAQAATESQSQERRTGVARQVLPIVLVVLALGNALLYALVLRPSDARFRDEQRALTKLEDDVKIRRANVDRLRDVQSRLGEAQRTDAAFIEQKFLPRGTGFSTIMEELQKLATDTHVKRSGVPYNLTELKGHPGLHEVEMQMQVEGEYANIIEFINRVERDPLFLRIDQIAASGGGPAPGQMTGQMPGQMAMANQQRPVRLTIGLVAYFRSK